MPSIGASGILGIAPETVSGTYVAPTKFFPFDSESINWTQDNTERRPIRNTPGLVGVTRGNGHVEGEITLDCTVDALAWLLTATRCTYTKTGTAPNFVYVFTPAAVAIPAKTISITVKRGSEVSGYTGCVIHGFTITTEDAALKLTVQVLGNAEEAKAAALTPTWPTTVPFGAGMYKLEIPTATQVFDTDTFEFSVEDNGEAQNRLKDTLGAQFIKFGESSATLSVERDFETRAELDQYKNVTSKAITFTATKGGANAESIKIDAPVSFINSYEYNLSSVGDLVRSSVEYVCAIDAAGAHYKITINTAEALP